MSSYNQQKLITHLDSKWGMKGCPMCGTGKWGVSDKVMELREYNEGNLVVGGTLQPVVPVNCLNCGYTILVNGIIAGIVERPKVEGAK